MLRCSTLDQIGVRELRQQASRYLERVAAGEAFVITEYGKPVAVLASTMEAVRAESDAVLERLVEARVYPSIDAAVAADVEELAHAVRERLTTDLIVAGYRRIPQTDDAVTVALRPASGRSRRSRGDCASAGRGVVGRGAVRRTAAVSRVLA